MTQQETDGKALGSLAATEGASAGSSASDAASHAAHTCGEMSRGSTWNRFPCGKKARFLEKKWGKENWFCGTHAPSEVERRRRERRDAYEKAMQPTWDAEVKRKRLRDSAPDLLEAAKLAALHFKRMADSWDLFISDDEYEVWTALNAAIAKAEGR